MLRYVATLLPTRRNFGALLIDRKHSGGCYRMPIINALVRDLQCETTMATLTKPCCVPSLITAHEINMPIECCSTVHITSKSTVNKLRLSGRGMMMQHAEGKLKNLVEFVERINFLASTHKCINIHLLQLIGECASICSACIAGADKHDHETYARLYSVIHSLKNSPSSTYLRDVGSIIENSDDSLISNELREAKAIADSAFNVMISTWMKKEASYYESFCSISGNDRNSMKQLRALNDLLDREYQAQIKMSARLAQQSSLVLADVNDLLKLLYPNKGIAAVITPFGSRYNGLGSLSSDLDLSVSFYRGTERIPVLLPARRKQLQQNLQQIPGALKAANILREIRYALQKSRQFRFVDMVLSSRVPIIKLEHCRTKMQLDIAVDNGIGVQNTLLVSAFVQSDVRIHKVLLALKRWVRARRLNEASVGLLSSLSWCFLALHAMRHAGGEYVVPSFQRTPQGQALLDRHDQSRPAVALNCDEIAMFELIPPEINANYASSNITAAELLLAFFAFYGSDRADAFQFLSEIVSLQPTQRVFRNPIDTGANNDADDDATAESDNRDDPADAVDDQADPGDKEQQKVNVDGNESILKWRMTVMDPFGDGNLARVISNRENQIYIISELRRGYIQFSSISKHDNLSLAWDGICEDRTDFTEGGFCVCTFCGGVGHLVQYCPKKVCSRCKARGHQADVCSLIKTLRPRNRAEQRLLLFMPRKYLKPEVTTADDPLEQQQHLELPALPRIEMQINLPLAPPSLPSDAPESAVDGQSSSAPAPAKHSRRRRVVVLSRSQSTHDAVESQSTSKEEARPRQHHAPHKRRKALQPAPSVEDHALNSASTPEANQPAEQVTRSRARRLKQRERKKVFQRSRGEKGQDTHANNSENQP